MSTVTVTRKIELYVSPISKKGESEKDLSERRKAMNNKIYGLCRFNHKLANICVSKCIHYYGLDNSLYNKIDGDKDTVRDTRNAMNRAIYADMVDFSKNDEYLKKYSDKTTKNIDAVKVEVTKKFRKEAFDVATKGDKTLTSYKSGYPVYVSKRAIIAIFKDFDIDNLSFTLYGVQLKMNFGKDNSNNREVIKRIHNGKYSIGDSKLITKNKKIFLLLSVTMPQEEKKLDKSIVVGADLGISVPIVASVFKDVYKRSYIGNSKELFKTRTSLKARKRRLQSQLKLTKGGKGRNKKLKALDKFNEVEKNTRNTFNHRYSKAIVEFCVNNNAGTLVMENLSNFGKDNNGNSKDKYTYILSNWSYFDLQTKIEYKAKQLGIDVHFINPKYTSQRCSKCGHIHSGNRPKNKKTQAFFKCVSCDYETNADLNASQNISDVFVNNLVLSK